jgi:hypothetical protein
MNGNPYGKVFSGNLVRNTISMGAGVQNPSGLYLDFCYALTVTEEQYYLFSTLDTHSRILNRKTFLTGTVGFKF